MKEHFHSRIAKLLVVLALAVVASVMFVFVGCSSECAHENTHTETVAATCTTAGHTDTVCDDCGETINTEEIAALKHDYQLDESKTVASTCTVAGSETYVCSRCGDTYTQQLPLAEHSFKEVTVASTCTTAGYTVQRCEVCGFEKDRTALPLVAHEYETVTVASTCTTAGYTVEVCSVCGRESNRTALPLVAHEYETVTENATCTTNGYTVQVCANCGHESNRTSIAALGHDYQVVTEGAVEETCTTNGYHFEECTRCHDRKQITDPALGHDLVAGTPIAATCTTNGYTPYECSRCDYTEQRNVIAATGHKFGELIAYQPTDCTTDGYYYRLCSECKYRETSDRIAAKGHMIDFEAATTKINPITCAADGSVEFTCTDCDKVTTATADEIKNGTVRVSNIPTKNLTDEKDTSKVLAEYYAPNMVTEKGEAVKEEAITEDNAAQYFLQSFGHVYKYGWDSTKPTCKAEAALTDKKTGAEYYDVCERCETKFAVTAHTAPEGALPCVSIADNENFDASDFPNVSDRRKIAYVCTKCDSEVAVKDHDYQVMHLVDGQVNYNAATGEWEASKTDAPVWEAATEALNCTYYYVCDDCGKIEIAQPHNTNGAEPTCTEGVYCTVCGALVDPATGHDAEFVGGAFGDFKTDYVAATCVDDAYTMTHCASCAAREKAGKDVEWVLGENYKITVKENTATGHNYVKTTVYDESSTAVGCARPFYYQDVCTNKGCTESTEGHVRISVKPTLYEKQADNSFKAVEKPTNTTENYYYVIVNGVYAPFTGSVEDYNKNQYKIDTTTYSYTDAEGLYGYQAGGSHTWVAQKLDYTKSEYSANFVQPTCTTDEGKVLYTCSKCGYSDWRSISLGNYYILMTGFDDTAKSEFESAVGTKYDTLEAAAEAKALTEKAYHSDTMLPCGHPLCYDCVPANSNHTSVQWTLDFELAWDQEYPVSTALPTVNGYVAYGCRTYEYNQAQVQAIRDKLAADTNYNYAFYKDAQHTQAYTETDWTNLGKDLSEDSQFNEYVTIYVTVQPKAVADVFGGIGWLANGSLSTDIHLNDTWVDLSEIDSIEIAYIRPDRVDEFGRPLDNYVMASATSEGAGLEALKKVLKVNDKTKDWNFTCGYFLQPEYVDDLADPDGYWTWVINDLSFVATNGHYNTNASGAGNVDNCSVRLTVTIGNNVMTWTMAF